MRKVSSVLSIILAVCLTIGGVSAAWVFATDPEAFDDLHISLDAGYTITYINEGEVLYKTDPIPFGDPVSKDDLQEHHDKAKVKLDAQIAGGGLDNDYSSYDPDLSFKGWMNVGTDIITEIAAGNLLNIVLYPAFNDLFTASFVDMNGNVLSYLLFTTSTTNSNKAYTDAKTEATEEINDIFAKESEGEIYTLSLKEWKIRYGTDGATDTLENIDFSKGLDITIFPIPQVSGVAMEYVDENNDGIIEEFIATGYGTNQNQISVVIPDSIAGKNVTQITSNAFSSYRGLHVVQLPKEVELVGDNAISDASIGGWFNANKGETVTLYYSGSKSEWLAREAKFDDKWDWGMSENSIIYFLNGGDKVDPREGYLKLDHQTSGTLNITLTGVTWVEHTIDQAYINTMYNKICNCDEGDHDYGIDNVYDRIPDYIYWGTEDGTTAITMPTS